MCFLNSLLQLLLVSLITISECDYLYPNIPSTTFPFPEIIINKNLVPSSSGYVYPIPQQPFLPPLQDEIPPAIEPPNAYLPSVEAPSNELVPPQNDYLPPNDFQPILPPVYGVPPSSENSGRSLTPIVRVISMSCLDSVQNRFFRATIQSSDFVNSSPLFMKSHECHLHQQSSDIIMINLEGGNVGDCGVRYCADRKMCLNLRIPTVKGLKLPEDRVISLQCIPQSAVASVVKTLGIKTHTNQARTRSLGTIATGGTQRLFEPHIAIYRRGNSNSYEFTQLVAPGSSVFLGEELLLKATIKESDGWKFAKIGAVIMQQGIQQSNGRKSITLVDNNGCRVDGMKSVCPEHPRQVNNRVAIMPFRAFLFQDVDSDEMLLSVRIFGCMHHEDCQAKHCNEEKASDVNNGSSGIGKSVGRRKRKAINYDHTNPIANNSTSDKMFHSYHELPGDYSKRHQGTPTMTHQNITMHPLKFNNNNRRSVHNMMQDYESHLDFRVVSPDMTGTNRPSNYTKRINNESSIMNVIHNGYLIACVLLIVGILSFVLLYVVINRLVAVNESSNKAQGVYDDYFQKY